MFEINPITRDIILTRGNTAKINIAPCICGKDSQITLGDKDVVVFTVRSPSRQIYIQKILDKNSLQGDSIEITCDDTINMSPFRYLYDVLLVIYNEDTKKCQAYTYIDSAYFEIVEAQSDTTALPVDNDSAEAKGEE